MLQSNSSKERNNISVKRQLPFEHKGAQFISVPRKKVIKLSFEHKGTQFINTSWKNIINIQKNYQGSTGTFHLINQ